MDIDLALMVSEEELSLLDFPKHAIKVEIVDNVDLTVDSFSPTMAIEELQEIEDFQKYDHVMEPAAKKSKQALEVDEDNANNLGSKCDRIAGETTGVVVKHQQLVNNKCQKIFEAVDRGQVHSFTDILMKCAVPTKQAKLWLSQRDKFELEIAQNTDFKDLRKVSNFQVELNLVDYFEKCHIENTPLIPQDLLKIAHQIAYLLKVQDFQASDFWLACFMSRYHISKIGHTEVLGCDLPKLEGVRIKSAKCNVLRKLNGPSKDLVADVGRLSFSKIPVHPFKEQNFSGGENNVENTGCSFDIHEKGEHTQKTNVEMGKNNNSNLRIEKIKLQIEINDLKATVANLKDEVHRKNTELAVKEDDFLTQLTEKTNDFDAVVQEMRDMQSVIDDLTTENEQMKSEVNELQATRDSKHGSASKCTVCSTHDILVEGIQMDLKSLLSKTNLLKSQTVSRQMSRKEEEQRPRSFPIPVAPVDEPEVQHYESTADSDNSGSDDEFIPLAASTRSKSKFVTHLPSASLPIGKKRAKRKHYAFQSSKAKQNEMTREAFEEKTLLLLENPDDQLKYERYVTNESLVLLGDNDEGIVCPKKLIKELKFSSSKMSISIMYRELILSLIKPDVLVHITHEGGASSIMNVKLAPLHPMLRKVVGEYLKVDTNKNEVKCMVCKKLCEMRTTVFITDLNGPAASTSA